MVGVSLDAIAPSRETVARLRAAAKRHVADAQSSGISAETRFAAAYTAIRMLADMALNANGYRTLTSRPGHHQTAIQTLPLTVGLPAQTVQVLDALRKQRHLTEYSGDLIPESAVTEAVAQAKTLLAWVNDWLKRNHPELL
ncbi:DNA-binding protein [Piscinibacter sp.]|uniref:DNA-binding protein n=1 Tax=Piscinibacter sp. TaxID=1903157 RepID=UPI002F40CA29